MHKRCSDILLMLIVDSCSLDGSPPLMHVSCECAHAADDSMPVQTVSAIQVHRCSR